MADRQASAWQERSVAAETRPLTELTMTDEVAWAVLESAPDAVLLVDGNGRIALANRQVEVLFGYDRAELLGAPVEVLVPDAARRAHAAHRLRYRAEPRTRSMGAGMELSGQRRDGSLIPVEISLSPVPTGDTVLTVAAVRDISARRASESEVRRVRNALDTTRDGVYLFDPDDLHFSHVNSGAALQTGYTRAQLCTMTPMHLLPDYDDRSTRGIVRSLREGAERAVEITTWLRRADGDDVPIEMLLQFTPATRDDPAVCTAVVRDVTERVRAQQQLLEAERQLALLDDRERIGRDLHDRVIQRLFSAGLGLQSIAAAVDDEAIATRLERAIDEVDNSIRDLRTVIFGLSRRSRGGGASLKQAVLELATESARALSFEPRVRFDGPVDTMVPAAMSEHVMAALREILANVAKHAGATHVDVELAVGDMFVLRVRDDGIGLPDPLPRHGDGLRNLQQRAASLGGTFHAVPAEPTGTIVEWEVPLVAGDAGGADPGPTALPDLGARN